MAAAPAAELAQLDSIRVVTPALVCLVIATLAVLAGKRYRDSNVSASHLSNRPLTAKYRARKRGWPKNSAWPAAGGYEPLSEVLGLALWKQSRQMFHRTPVHGGFRGFW
jgi:hypothetical protein